MFVESWIDTWLDLPVWGVFVTLVIAFAFSATLIHLVSYSSFTRSWSQGFTGIVAPFFSSVAILFALLTGFLANEVWERNRQASRAIMAERGGFLAIQAISIATVSDMAAIRQAARTYLELLVKDEWPRMLDHEDSQEAGRALQALLTRVSAPEISDEAGQVAHAALLDAVLSLRSARYDRLTLSQDRTDRTKWAVVLILGLITQLAIAVVHLEKPRAQAATLTIFSTAAIVSLGLIAIREHPFDGALRHAATPLEEVLQGITPPSSP